MYRVLITWWIRKNPILRVFLVAVSFLLYFATWYNTHSSQYDWPHRTLPNPTSLGTALMWFETVVRKLVRTSKVLVRIDSPPHST